MKFSVIIVNYNTAKLTLDCIRSIRKYCTFDSKNFEIIVVDNDSKEDDKRELQLACSKYDFQFIGNQTNQGFGKANNIAVNKAKGEYVFFINSDVFIQEKYVFSQVIEDFNKTNEAGLIGCKVLNPDGSIQSLGNYSPNMFNLFLEKVLFLKSNFFNNLKYRDYTAKGLYKVGWVSGCFFAIRKEDYQVVGGFDEKIFLYSEDVDLCLKIKRIGKKIFVDDRVSIYHIRGASVEGKKQLKDYRRLEEDVNNINYIFNKHGIFTNKTIIKVIFKLNYYINNLKEHVRLMLKE